MPDKPATAEFPRAHARAIATATISLLAAALAAASVISWRSPETYAQLIATDGLVAWLTLIFLAVTALLAVRNCAATRRASSVMIPLAVAVSSIAAIAAAVFWGPPLRIDLCLLIAVTLCGAIGARTLSARETLVISRIAARIAWPAALAVCVLAACWIARGLWVDGIPTSNDGARHLLRAHVMRTEFLPSGRVNGWSPYWHLGAQLFLFQSYGYFALIAAAHLVLTPILSMLTVYKIFYLAPYALMPLAMAYLARACDLGRPAAAAAAFSTIALTTQTGFGVTGLFETGLLLQAVGIMAIALLWPTLRSGLHDGGTSLVFASTGAGVLLVTHFLSGAYLLIVGTLYVLTLTFWSLSWQDGMRRAVTLALIALGLSAHALLPTWELRERMGPSPGWIVGTTLESLFNGALFGSATWTLACAVGLATIAWHGTTRSRELLVIGVVTFSFSLFPASELQWLPKALALPFDLMSPRGQGYAALIACVAGGAGLAFVARTLAQRGGLGRIAAMALIGAAIGSLWAEAAPRADLVRTQGHLAPEKTASYRETMRWLDDNVTPPATIGFEHRVFGAGQSGAIRLSSLINMETGLYSLAGDQMELGRYTHHHLLMRAVIDTQSPRGIAERLRLRGVSHIIVRAPKSEQRLASAAALTTVFKTGKIAIMEVAGPHRWMTENDTLHVQRFNFSAHDVTWQVENTRFNRTATATPTPMPTATATATAMPTATATRAVIPINEHPNWRLTIDGSAAAIGTTPDGLIQIDVPPGVHEVELRYGRRATELAAAAISLITLMFCIVAVTRRRHA